MGLGQPGVRARRRRTATSTPACRGCRWRSSTSSPTSCSASTSSTALEPVPVARLEQPAVQPVAPGGWRPAIATIIVVGNVLVPDRRAGRDRLECDADRGQTDALDRRLTRLGGSDAHLDAKIPDGPAGRQVGPTSRADVEARQPEQQAQVQGHRRRHRARRRVGCRHARRARLSGRGVHVPRLARRAHSIAAQGGINAAKNYRGDGDSVYRLFYDTIKGGDFRSREAQRLPPGPGVGEHHRPDGRPGRAVRPRVRRPARQPQLRRRPGQPHVLRPRPDRPAAAARRVPADGPPGRASARSRCGTGWSSSTSWSIDGRCAGIVTRDLLTGEVRSHAAHAVVLAPAATATCSSCRPTPWPATSRRPGGPTAEGPAFANPCYTQIHPTCIPQSDDFQSKLTLMSESLRNDGRVWVPHDADETRPPDRRSPRPSATTTSSGSTRASATSPRGTSPRAPPSAPSTPAAASGR